jgi:hypothetical protein
MQCKTARLLIAIVPAYSAELDEAEAAALETHLTECDECAALARSDREADDRLRAAMREVPVPDSLRGQLLQQCSERQQRVFRRRLVSMAAAAALLLGVAFGAWWWVKAHLPIVDVNKEVEEVAGLQGAPPETIRNFFAANYGINVPLPTGLNYAHLDSANMQDHQGKLVPHLLFVRGGKHAHVFILTADKFNIKASLQNAVAGSRGITVEVRQSDEDPRVAYEIVFTGDSLDWLREAEPPSV